MTSSDDKGPGPPNADVDLRLEGKVVSRCCIDSAFCLEILESGRRTVIRIGGQMDIGGGRVRLRLSGERVAEAMQACILVGRTIGHAVARKDGRLEIDFSDGSELRVAVDPHFEAWEASADDGFMVVSLPGGGLAVWSSRREQSQASAE